MQQQQVDHFLANLALADALGDNDPAEAIRYYQAALAIQPQAATAHNNLAVALIKVGRSAEAIAEFEQSVGLDANSAAPHYNLGRALSPDQPQRAIEHLRQAAQRKPGLVSAHRALAELYLQTRKYPEAQASLQTCLALLTNDVERGEIINLLKRCETQK